VLVLGGKDSIGMRNRCNGETPIAATGLLAAGTPAVLDSSITPLDKISVARDILVAVDEAEREARIPDVREVLGERDDPAYEDLVSTLQDQLDRAATNAFSRSFLAAALLGVAALVPILLSRRDVSL